MPSKRAIKVNYKVAKSAEKGSKWLGFVTKLKGDTALVEFPSRGFSRWCKKSNLDIVLKNGRPILKK